MIRRDFDRPRAMKDADRNCFTEPQGARALASVFRDDAMIVEMCTTLCAGERYIGV
jgi:hypothetical protein